MTPPFKVYRFKAWVVLSSAISPCNTSLTKGDFLRTWNFLQGGFICNLGTAQGPQCPGLPLGGYGLSSACPSRHLFDLKYLSNWFRLGCFWRNCNLARCLEVGAGGVRTGVLGIGVSGLMVGTALELGAVVMVSSMSGDVGESVVAL